MLTLRAFGTQLIACPYRLHLHAGRRSLRSGIIRSEIMKKLAGRDDAVWFRAPVKRAMLPDYFSKIKKPMDLRTMEDRINSFE